MGEPGEWLRCCASKPGPSQDGPAGLNVRGKCVLALYISNMAPNIRCFVTARGVLDRVLEKSEFLQELAKQIFTNVGCTERRRTILRGDYGFVFSSAFLYVFIITIPKFLTLFSVMKFPCNEDISVFQRFPCTECVCLTQNQTSSRKPPHTVQNSVKYMLVLWEKQTKRNETGHGTARTRRYPNHNVETEVSNRIYREVTGRVVDTT
jgi:hypothetical protein